MIAAWILWTALSGPALAAECASGYDPKFLKDWDVRPEDWRKACALGYDQKDALHALVKKSVEQCADRFLKPAKAKKIGETQVRSYCAQGFVGRARLEELVMGPKPPPSAEIKKIHPKATALLTVLPEGLGPIQQVLENARSSWKEDACLAAFLITADGLGTPGKETATLRFRLYSKTDWKRTFEYRLTKAAPPDGKPGPKSTGHHCLSGVEIDGGDAVGKAADAGFPLETVSTVELRLDTVSKDMIDAAGKRSGSKAPLSDLKDKTFWRVSGKPRVSVEYFIDARSGEVLYHGAPVDLDALAPKRPPPKE